MAKAYVPLLIEARHALGLSQSELARLLASSLRTVERMHAGRSHPSSEHWGMLIRALHPKDPELAARIAAACGGRLEQFGIAPPASTPPPALAPRVPVVVAAHEVESVLFAAAVATDLPLSSVRAVLGAALARARELGLSVEGLSDGLGRGAT